MKLLSAIFLILCMVLSSIPAYALDSYNDEMTTTTGWTITATYGSVTAVTWEGASALKFIVTASGSGRASSAQRVVPVTGSNMAIKFTADPDVMGTQAQYNGFGVVYYGGSSGHFVYLGSDGFFVYNTSGSYIEVGVDIVDVGVKTDWEIRIVGVNTNTATIAVYKNNVYQGSVGNAGYTNTTASGTFVLRQYGYTLNNATTYVDSISVTSYGLNYFENCDSITDWTDADVGNGVSTQETFDSKSTFKFLISPAAGGSSTLRRYSFQGGSLPNKLIAEFRVYHDVLGTIPDANRFAFAWYRSTTYTQAIYLASDGFFVYNGTAYVEVGNNIVDLDTWTTWRILYDTTDQSADNKVKLTIWKNGVLVASNQLCGDLNTGFTANTWQFVGNGTTLQTLSYVDYLRIYSEDGQLIQTVIE